MIYVLKTERCKDTCFSTEDHISDFNFVWAPEGLKYLGIFLSSNINFMVEKNLEAP